MKRLKIILGTLSVFFFITIYAQDFPPNDPFKVPDVIPKSPEASGLGNYGAVPISEYTGVPNISIPLYTLSFGDIIVPINLSYDASGIKVGQEATYVGLGWNLIAGGCIIYEPVGADERMRYGPTYDPLPYWELWQTFLTEYSGGMSMPVYSTMTHDQTNYPPYPYSEIVSLSLMGDGEQDMYSVHFLNYSFKFILHPDTHLPVFVDKKNKCLITRSGIDYIITGEDGIKYYFEEEEQNLDPGIMSPNCWYLSKIVDLKGNIVTFNYENFGQIYPTPAFSEENIYISVEVPAGKKRMVLNSYRPTSNLYLTEITAKSYTGTELVKVIFNLVEGRLDINGPGARRLQDIIVTDKLTNETRVRYLFGNDFYFDACDVGGDFLSDDDLNTVINYVPSQDNLKKRLKLVSLAKVNPNNPVEIIEKYLFTYNEAHQLPYKTSFAQDFWGYYNGQENYSDLFGDYPYYAEHTMIPDANAMDYCLPEYSDIFDHFKTRIGANRGASSNYITSAMLQSITYPTGGKTVFEFEPHTFNNEIYLSAEDLNLVLSDPSIINNAQYIGGGVRIKTITNKDHNNVILSVKKYSYIDANYPYSSGLHLAPLMNWKEHYAQNLTDVGTHIYGGKYMLSNHSYEPLPVSMTGTNVGYSRVIMEELDNTQNNGKIISEYKNDLPLITWDKVDFHNNSNGNLLHRYFLNTQGTTIRVENYNYVNADIEMEVLNLIAYDTYFGPQVGGSTGSIDDRWQFLTYSTSSFWNYLQSKEIIEYLGSNQISTLTEYTYNLSNYCIDQIKQINSDNKIKYTQFDYPGDFFSTSPYTSMFAANRINPVIEQREYIGDPLVQTRRVKTNYTTTSIINPQNVEIQEGNNTSEIRLMYDQYDAVGNLLQYHKTDDINFSYIWGYNGTYPVAKIENANYNTVINILTISELVILSSGNSTDVQIRTVINKIRTHPSMANAFVYTYTFKPLVGKTSETDPNGKTTYYEYDSFGRLQNIKDQDGNILQVYQYHYKE